MAKKDSLITAITFIVLIAAFATGIYFLIRLVSKPDSDKKTEEATMSGELKTYTHPDYGFSFDYPANFTVGKFPEGDGEVILVQGEDGKQGFQIFVTLYEEENTLSKAIIQESFQGSTLGEIKELRLNLSKPTDQGKVEPLAGQGSTLEELKALSFDTGDTHEIWFVVEGNLYQIASYKDFGDTMEEIIKSLRFN